MALGNSNTFVSPKSTKAISLARIDWNNSQRSLLQNFYSAAAPDSDNITLEGTATAPLNGMWFRSSDNGRIYINDSLNEKGNPVYGGDWTRNGIGHVIEESLAAADFTSYEIGESFVTVGSNTRMYVKTNNTSGIADIGIPPTDSVTATMLKSAAVTADKIAGGAVTTVKIVDEAVTYAKMQHATASRILGRRSTSTGDVEELLAGDGLEIDSTNVHLREVSFITGMVENPSNKTYVLDERAKYAYNINDFTRRTSAGTITTAIQINGTNVGGMGGMGASTTQATTSATGSNSVSVGQRVTMVTSSDATTGDLFFTMEIIRQ